MKKEDKKITPIGGQPMNVRAVQQLFTQINYSSCTAFCQGRRPKNASKKKNFRG